MRIAFIYNKRHLDISECRSKMCPNDYAYGAFGLEELGHTVDFIHMDPWIDSDYSEARKSRSMAMITAFGSLFLNGKITGAHIAAAWHISRKLHGKYDVVITIHPKTTLAFAFCRWVGRCKLPIVGTQAGISNGRDNLIQRFLFAHVFRHIVTFILSESEYHVMRSVYGLGPHEVSLIPFGIDVDFWTPAPVAQLSRPMVLSVGSDVHRDFVTLLEASKGIDADFRIVTNLKMPSVLPPNVKVICGSLGNPAMTFLELRELYRSATSIVTPIKNTLQPSGQSSTLQAMACGIPAIVTNYSGLWSRDQIKDGVTALLYREGDSESLRNAINRIIHDKELSRNIAEQGRAMVASITSSRMFADKLNTICMSIMQGPV